MANEISSDVDGSRSRYGDVTAADNARVQVGDNHYHQKVISTDLDLNIWRGRFFDALAYDDMHGKSQQLDSVDAPTASFDWLNESSIPDWLEKGSGIFWISGKPGSGKSVLMKHIVSSYSTKQRLDKWKKGCLILEFFFDFRAARNDANDISGMLKLFLVQLSSQSDVATKHFRQLNASTELHDADVAKLSKILSNTVQRCDLPVCAFVDGLDEYEGDWVDLINILQRLEDRMGMKICLASRPEPQLKELLHAYESIIMQDHNIASLRVYIDRALIRARRFNPDIGAKFTEPLKDEICLKAQGIILWARLAVDELIRACSSGKSEDEMKQIFDTLPPEVEDMYQRILSKLPLGFVGEGSMIIEIVIAWRGHISLQELFGLWDLFVQDFSIDVQDFDNMSLLGFCKRMDHILATLLDLLPDGNVRLLHKTLHEYFRETSWVDRNIPQGFKELFPDHERTRIQAYVVRRATTDNLVSAEKLENYRADVGFLKLDVRDLQTTLCELCESNEDVHWPRRMQVLAESAMLLPSHLRRDQDQSRLFQVYSSTLTSPLMHLIACCGGYPFIGNELQAALRSSACRPILDMVFAVALDAQKYARWRLQTPLAGLTQIQALMDISIDIILNNAASRTAIEVVSAMAHRGAHRTRYHPCLIMSGPLWDDRPHLDQICSILSMCPQDLDTESHRKGCFDRHSNRPLLFLWVGTPEQSSRPDHMGKRASVRGRILDFIIDSSKDTKGTFYYRQLTPDAVVDYPRCDPNGLEQQRVSYETLKILIAAGFNLRAEHLDHNLHEYAPNLGPASSSDARQDRSKSEDAGISPRPSQLKRRLRSLFRKQKCESQITTQHSDQTQYQSSKSKDSSSSKEEYFIITFHEPNARG